MVKKKYEKIIHDFFRIFWISFIFAIIYGSLIFLPTIPYVFDLFYGDKILNKTLYNITQNLTNPDDIAIAIMGWEEDYFNNPYSHYDSKSILQKYLHLYKIDDDYKLFIRGGPVSWIIYSRLANCGEYANMFVYLMNKKGIKSRVVKVRGEDHVWAEYLSDGFNIVVDPSINQVISNKKKFAENMNWSYIESIDIFNSKDKKDVSDEYIQRGALSVYIPKNGKPAKDARVIIKSAYLMKIDPDRYKEPKIVLAKKINDDGFVTFELGEKEYIIEIRKNYFAFNLIYNKNATVKINEEEVVSFDLSKDKKEIKFFNI